MERQANYALVGVLSILLLIGSLVFVVWLAQFQFNQTYDNYRIVFHGPVSGLSKGGEVQFNGIKVGEITAIRLDPADPNRVITDIQLTHDTPVRADSLAQSVSQGITGVKFIQISAGSPGVPMLRKVSRDRPPVIASAPSRMENMMQDVSQLTHSAALALGKVNRLLSDENVATISRSLADVGAVTAELRARKGMFGDIEHTFTKLDNTANELGRTVASIRTSLGNSDRGALADLSGAVREFHGAIGDARTVIATLKGPADDFSTVTVPKLTAAMDSIERAANSLDRLASDIGQDPQATLGRPGGRELEIPK